MAKLKLESFDHPLFFVLALSLVMIPMLYLWGMLFKTLGLSGAASVTPV